MSLRDVERAMQVMVWFFKHVDTLGRLMRRVIIQQRREEGEEVEDDDDHEDDEVIMVSLLLLLDISVNFFFLEKYRWEVEETFKYVFFFFCVFRWTV